MNWSGYTTKKLCGRCGHSQAVHFNKRGSCNVCPREVYNVFPDGSRVRKHEETCNIYKGR